MIFKGQMLIAGLWQDVNFGFLQDNQAHCTPLPSVLLKRDRLLPELSLNVGI